VAEKSVDTPVPGRSPDPSNVLRLLRDAQSKFGYLPENSLVSISDSLGIALTEVYGVATFYSFLSVRPQGRHVIRICKSLPCFLKKSRQLLDAIEDATGARLGMPSADARFSLHLTNCIGECDKAPAMMVDGHVYVGLTSHKVSQILKGYE
jgi:NADH:ubiquinone oxidoreductase subunit E